MKKDGPSENRALTNEDLENFAIKYNLANMATKEDLADVVEMITDANRHADVLLEESLHKIDLILEGFRMFNDRMERNEAENDKEHGKLDKLCLENKAETANLATRVNRLENKIA